MLLKGYSYDISLKAREYTYQNGADDTRMKLL